MSLVSLLIWLIWPIRLKLLLLLPCIACDVDGATDDTITRHPMERCAVWNSLTQKDREKKVKCVKHPFKDDHTTQECEVDGRKCKFCSKDNHHFFLCSKKPPSKSSSCAAKAAFLTVQMLKLGKVFGGSDPGLVFSTYTMSYPMSFHQVSLGHTVHTYTMKAMVREATYTTPA